MPRWFLFRVLGVLSLASILGGCRTPRAKAPLASMSAADAARTSNPVASNTLGRGDMLEVKVFQETDLSGVFRVSDDGTIDFPLCGKVKLIGKTQSQSADELTTCLKNGYLKNPQVSVLIREFSSKKIFIFGEVQKPGTFPYDEDMSVVQAITLAGGFTKTAAKNSTSVTRRVAGQEKKIRIPVEDIATGREANFVLQPGDIIFVPESFF